MIANPCKSQACFLAPHVVHHAFQSDSVDSKPIYFMVPSSVVGSGPFPFNDMNNAVKNKDTVEVKGATLGGASLSPWVPLLLKRFGRPDPFPSE